MGRHAARVDGLEDHVEGHDLDQRGGVDQPVGVDGVQDAAGFGLDRDLGEGDLGLGRTGGKQGHEHGGKAQNPKGGPRGSNTEGHRTPLSFLCSAYGNGRS